MGKDLTAKNRIDEMSGEAFERFCLDMIKKMGYKDARLTSASGDYGVDILARKKRLLYAFQCKRYSGNVGISAVQQAYSGMKYYGCDEAVVVTNSYFTAAAKKTAEQLTAALWDRDILNDAIRRKYGGKIPSEKKLLSHSTQEKSGHKGLVVTLVLALCAALAAAILLL